MTRATSRVLDPSSEYYDALPSTLWKPANIPQLPSDAPAELKKYTIDVGDPKKVYVLYRAQRRHGFQDLVQRFENQLVYGCQAPFCDTPTCFTCARRVAGKAPIRQFHDTSARTLACYLASQDNPDRSLCRNPSAAPLERSATCKKNASNPNIAKRASHSPAYIIPPARRQSDETSLGREIRTDIPDKLVVAHRDERDIVQDEQKNIILAQRIDRLQEPKKKDSKSFIQSLYGTVSLKMLDWLSPQSLYALSSPEGTPKSPQDDKPGIDAPIIDSPSVENINSSHADTEILFSSTTTQKSAQTDLVLPPQKETRPNSETPTRNMSGGVKTEPKTPEIVPESQAPLVPSKSRAIIIPSQSATSDGQVEANDLDILSKLPQEKAIKPTLSRRRSIKKSHRLSASRQVTPILDLNVEIETCEADCVREGNVGPHKQSGVAVKPEEANASDNVKESGFDLGENHYKPVGDKIIQPQTLSLITPEIVEFFCNFMQDHGLCETHELFPTKIDAKLCRFRRDVPPINFLLDTGVWGLKSDTKSSVLDWKKFIEQSLFYVLSDPAGLLRSFMTEQDSLMDSLSMWYIMVRLTRVSPTLVFDSLWMSSSRLFKPPKELQSKHYRIPRSITNAASEAFEPCQSDEAAHLVLIYLHALTAAMPLKYENKLGAKASSWSRIFNGERRAVVRELSPGVYRRRLQYYDAFTNESALRLARRLFSGIASVLRYEYLVSIEREEHPSESQEQFFDVLLRYIESSQFSRKSSADMLLDFSHEYSDPESAVTTSTYHDLSKQMVEWARTVILQEWKGEVEVSNDGVFGGALAFMSAMYRNQEKVALNDSDFIVEHFAGRLNSMDMPVEWLTFTPNRKTLHLLDHPYLFKASSLVDFFRSINLHRMRKAYETAVNFTSRTSMAMASGRLMTDSNHRQHLLDRLRTALSKYLVLEIRRDRVLQDAFDQLWRREARELLRPFKVRLGETLGEEGFDLGGVQQEFFRLAIAEALDPNYGTFEIDERTQMAWFVPSSLTPLWRCELIGLIVSLAVYNGLTLPVTFPQAMYRKLLGIENTEIEHIEDGWPDLARGLTALLEWDEEKDGNVADVFARTYEFSVDSFGEQISRDMSEWSSWPQFGLTAITNPKDAPLVDSNNRKAYVNDYIRWLTDISIRPQFEAFKSGFYTCLDRRSLSLLEPHILQSVVEGVQEIDITELRRNTRYVGWSASNRTVRDFWSIVKRYTIEQKKKLLEFVTASDRVPVGGMQGLHFVLQKNGTGDSTRLPTSYTCFATLLLPEYESKELLGEKLEIAISNARGFGFA